MFDSRTSNIVIVGESLPFLLGSATICEASRFFYKRICIKPNTCTEGSYFNPSTYTCDACLAPCLTCTSLSNCSSCTYGYYLNSVNQCFLCSSVLPHCLNCSTNTTANEFNCTTCAQGYYVDSSQQCELCSNTINGCLDCYDSSYCLTCSGSLVFSSEMGHCLSCGNIFSNCAECTNTTCTKCPAKYKLNAGQCQCILGY